MNWNVVREPTIILTAVVYGLLLTIASLAGPFGIPLAILIHISTWRYSYAVMRGISQGHQRLPPPDIESCNPVGEWAIVLHFFLFPGLMVLAFMYFPTPMAVVGTVILACVMPASAALVGVTSSIVSALNPVAIGHFIRIVGSDYWLLVLGSFLILIGASLFVGLLVPAFGLLSGLIGWVAQIWALYAIFALIGSLLRKNRLEFDIAGEVKPREDEFLEARHSEWRKDLDIAYTAFRSGMRGAGYKTLHDLVDANGDSIEVNYWLVENMLEWEEKRYAFEVVDKLLPRLLARGDRATALELYQRCRRRNPDFRPPPGQAAEIAEYAESIGQSGLANELSYTP